jgi:hypothetical protein
VRLSFTPARENNSRAEAASEDGIAIGDNGAGDAMEPNHCIEEHPSHRRCRVRMAEWYEVRSLGQAVNHSEQHRLVVDARETLDEVHAQISPNHRGTLEDGLHLLEVHGDTGSRDDMAEIGDVCPIELALQALDKELVFLQFSKDQVHVQQMLSPAAAVNQDVVKENEYDWNMADAFVKPNDMTKNSNKPSCV